MKLSKLFSFFALLLSFMTPTFCLSSLNDQIYTNTPLKNTAGIFYHNLGYAKIHTDDFSLISNTNISFLNKRINFVKSIFESTLILCSKAPESSSCQEPLKLIQIQIPQLEIKFQTIGHLVDHNQEIKRNVMDFLMACLKHLIGFLAL